MNLDYARSQEDYPTPIKEVLILGIGNTLCGDDGLGIQAIELLSTCTLPAWVEVTCVGTPGWELPLWLKGRRKAILVDALDMGVTPGEMHRFEIEAVKMITHDSLLSLHASDLVGGLALAEALNVLPPKVILLGIQPAQCQPGEDLSPQIKETLPKLVSAILDEVQRTRISNE